MYTSPSHFLVNSPKQNVPIEGIHLMILLTLNHLMKGKGHKKANYE